MSSSHVLVTGGAGYIGSHACKSLALAGYTPVTLDNLVYGHRANVRWGPFIEGDAGDEALVRRVLREHTVDAVMHFAGYAYVGESVQLPGKYYRNNACNTVAVLEAMRHEGVRDIVFSSTCATYGVPRAVPIAEDHPQDPVNPYGESKFFVERMLEAFRVAHGLRYAAHPSLFSVNDALAWIDRFKPRRAIITNLHSDLDYEVLRQSLPPGVIPAYDGMRLTLEQAG
jgi:UDP-arabinose 4-epimerase